MQSWDLVETHRLFIFSRFFREAIRQSGADRQGSYPPPPPLAKVAKYLNGRGLIVSVILLTLLITSRLFSRTNFFLEFVCRESLISLRMPSSHLTSSTNLFRLATLISSKTIPFRGSVGSTVFSLILYDFTHSVRRFSLSLVTLIPSDISHLFHRQPENRAACERSGSCYFRLTYLKLCLTVLFMFDSFHSVMKSLFLPALTVFIPSDISFHRTHSVWRRSFRLTDAISGSACGRHSLTRCSVPSAVPPPPPLHVFSSHVHRPGSAGSGLNTSPCHVTVTVTSRHDTAMSQLRCVHAKVTSDVKRLTHSFFVKI